MVYQVAFLKWLKTYQISGDIQDIIIQLINFYVQVDWLKFGIRKQILFKIVFQMNTSSKDQQNNFYMMQSGTHQRGVQDFIQRKGLIEISILSSLQSILQQISYFCILLYLLLILILYTELSQEQIIFSFQHVSIRVIQFGALFGIYDMLKSIMIDEVGTYFIAQFSSIMACFSDSLFYYFNKSSRFYFFYGERILVSKNGVALFLFDWLSSKDEQEQIKIK
ncbi:unnamed protein product [Paramecium octaurelia]|uniref:Transmembrane protein n=1 Tax=Paramecium octaurelia TaxID=43137 RepID=A0A8S1UV82_PAROT|nr:unnamed protein product [Paramecium octaurelia]